jgi:hypothetical protein
MSDKFKAFLIKTRKRGNFALYFSVNFKAPLKWFLVHLHLGLFGTFNTEKEAREALQWALERDDSLDTEDWLVKHEIKMSKEIEQGVRNERI